jgi:hypothetical protein
MYKLSEIDFVLWLLLRCKLRIMYFCNWSVFDCAMLVWNAMHNAKNIRGSRSGVENDCVNE